MCSVVLVCIFLVPSIVVPILEAFLALRIGRSRTEPRALVLGAASCAALYHFDIDLSQGFNPSEDNNCAGQSIFILYTVQLQLNLVYMHIEDHFFGRTVPDRCLPCCGCEGLL